MNKDNRLLIRFLAVLAIVILVLAALPIERVVPGW